MTKTYKSGLSISLSASSRAVSDTDVFNMQACTCMRLGLLGIVQKTVCLHAARKSLRHNLKEKAVWGHA